LKVSRVIELEYAMKSLKNMLISITAAVSVVFIVFSTSSCGSVDSESSEGTEPPVESNKPEVALTADQIELAGIKKVPAYRGDIEVELQLTGETALNRDRLAHISPRVTGVVTKVLKTFGEEVGAGEIIAVLESRELADAKSAYLAAIERLALAQANFDREADLWKKKISSEQEYLDAKQAMAEAKIEFRSSEQKLHALGLTEEDVASLPDEPDYRITRYEIRAPFAGVGRRSPESSSTSTLRRVSRCWRIQTCSRSVI